MGTSSVVRWVGGIMATAIAPIVAAHFGAK
jgi:hypothetical protein